MSPTPSESHTLVDTPAAVPAGTGRVEALIDDRPVGELDYQVCATCRRGIIHHVRVEPGHRRRGLAGSMIATVLRSHPDHTWSTATRTGGAAAAALWASVGSIDSDMPVTCRHMRRADGPRDEPYDYHQPWSAPRK